MTKLFERYGTIQADNFIAWRRFEEGWGIGTEAILPGPASAPTGTYTVTSLVTRVI